MKATIRVLGLALAMSLFTGALAAETAGAARYDASIQSKVAIYLAGKKQFTAIQASVEDGIVTLTGNVDLYQQKLYATKKVRKMTNVQGVRNLITVAGKSVSDGALEAAAGSVKEKAGAFTLAFCSGLDTCPSVRA